MIRMNDAAAVALGVLSGLKAAVPPDQLSPGLRRLVAEGVEVAGGVVVWSGRARPDASPPGIFPDLTGWERSVNSFHLEDEVPVEVATSDDGEPLIAERDQVTLLRQGVALALEVCRLITELDRSIPLRCIVSAGSTNGTFRFHRLRSGEEWLADLDRYELERLVVVDVQPPTPHG
jgi:hypothetical protein